MAFRISMSELGIANDDTVFEGQTPAEVLRRLAPYLKERHGIKLPDIDDATGGPGAIMPGRGPAALPQDRGVLIPAPAPGETQDAAVNLIMTRLAEKLNLRDSGLRADSDVDPMATAG